MVIWGGALAIARFQSNGTLDRTFSGNGKLVLWDFPPANAIVQDSKGGFVIAGVAFDSINFMRLNADGTLDKTFASRGGFKFGSAVFRWSVQSMTECESNDYFTIVGSRSNTAGSDILLARFKM